MMILNVLTTNRSTTKWRLNFDRYFDRKNTKFWPNLAILTEFLTENHRSEKRSSKLLFDRSVKKFWPTFWPKFPVKIIFWPKFWPKISVKILFWPKFWPSFLVKILFWPMFSVKISVKNLNFDRKSVKIPSNFWWSNLKKITYRIVITTIVITIL